MTSTDRFARARTFSPRENIGYRSILIKLHRESLEFRLGLHYRGISLEFPYEEQIPATPSAGIADRVIIDRAREKLYEARRRVSSRRVATRRTNSREMPG